MVAGSKSVDLYCDLEAFLQVMTGTRTSMLVRADSGLFTRPMQCRVTVTQIPDRITTPDVERALEYAMKSLNMDATFEELREAFFKGLNPGGKP